MRLVAVLCLFGFLPGPALAQPIRYEFLGEGIALREQAFVLDVPARSHADEASLKKARLRGKLRFENPQDRAGTLVLELRQEETIGFEYRPKSGLACFEADAPEPSSERARLAAQLAGRIATRRLESEGVPCLVIGPLSALPRKGGPPPRGRLDERYQVAVEGQVRKAAALRWEAQVEGGEPAKGAAQAGCRIQATQLAEYRFALPARGALEVEVTDRQPLREVQGCCSRTFEGSFQLVGPVAGGRVSFAAPDPLATRCRTLGHGGIEAASRVGGFELFVSATPGGSEEWDASFAVSCDVDDGGHVDTWPARVATVVAKAASSVLPSKTDKEGESAFGPASLVDGRMTPWCSSAVGARPGEWVEVELEEDVAAVSVALGEGPQVYGDLKKVPRPAGAKAAGYRSPTRIEFAPGGGGPAAATLDLRKGERAVTVPLALAKGPWRVNVTAAAAGEGPICIGEVDFVPVRDRRALEASALLKSLLPLDRPKAP